MENEGTKGTWANVHSRITEQIVSAIAAGVAKYEMPWHRSGPMLGRPRNVVSKKPYRGVNVLALWVAAQNLGFGTGAWATYRQWTTLGAQVRQGERGSVIVFYKEVETRADGEDAEDNPSPRLVARASWVFNADQVEGWKPPEASAPSNQVSALDRAEAFVGATGADIHEGSEMACYRPLADYIDMPYRSAFTGSSTSTPTECYYATLLHELTHWSGHEKRLSRDLTGRFGQDAYAMEELVAELGAAYLCADLSVANSPRPDHAAYVSSWLTVLRADARAIFAAATRASAAVDYLTRLSAKGHSQ